jgi:hypothetical protein
MTTGESTSDNSGLRTRGTGLWMACVLAVSFGAGLWAAFTPAVGPFIKPSAAVVLILAGLIFLFPFAIVHPTNELQRKFRVRLSIIGAGNLLYGVAQVVQSPEANLLLTGLTVVLLTAAAAGLPKGLFSPRS